jgi:contractile injection system spike tip protein
MADLIIVDGDTVSFLPSFGAATVVPVPTTISSSAATTKVGTKGPCLEGDEKNVQAQGAMYTTATHVTPGTGTLKIDKLNSDQLTTKSTFEGKKVILKGSMFDAVFEVQTPAQTTSSPPVTDPLAKHSGGKGSFVPTNATVLAT